MRKPPFSGVYDSPFPFHWIENTDYDNGPEGWWKPGTRFVENHPKPFQADGMGKLILTVVDHYKTDGYSWRVVFTLQLVTPEGKKSPSWLKFETRQAFKKRLKGYSGEEYILTPMAADFVQEAA